jgi:MoaA/NifB/PqqE/SkfB family radical SAM enzyme
MIRIVNWLLTRKCNLSCDYCSIVKNYENKPMQYPNMSYYFKNEMDTGTVIRGLKRIQKHNPTAFHIFYGGEPLLRKDLWEIVNYCNQNNIQYTIISNNTPNIKPLIEKLINKVGRLKGFTASIDPVFHQECLTEDRIIKSISGFENLIYMKKYCDDVVAEITVMKSNQLYLYDLLERLSKEKINGDITFIDIAKSPFYDFSNIKDEEVLVKQSPELANQFQKLMDSQLDIHMKQILLPAIWEILPSEMDCEIEKNLHNITIDSDGSLRLCLRIRGIYTPMFVDLENFIDYKTGEITSLFKQMIRDDKKTYCMKCNHTCLLMSKYIEKTEETDSLVHSDRRT